MVVGSRDGEEKERVVSPDVTTGPPEGVGAFPNVSKNDQRRGIFSFFDCVE